MGRLSSMHQPPQLFPTPHIQCRQVPLSPSTSGPGRFWRDPLSDAPFIRSRRMCLATAIYHLLRPSKPRPLRRCVSLIVLTSSLFTLLILFTLPFPTVLSALPQCKNALIFTGARQGSTWFVDSIENCSYSTLADADGTRKFATDVFKKTELWKHFGQPDIDGIDMTPYDALNYIVSNTSIKIFPSVFWRRRSDVLTILNERKRYNLTVLILRRNVEAAWDSWVRAESSNVWNGAVKTTNATFDEDLHKYFVESRERYDIGVEKLLNENDIEYDIFDYDEAKIMKTIIARNNRCVIMNCNYKTLNVVAGGDTRYDVADVDRSQDGDAAAAGEDAADAPV